MNGQTPHYLLMSEAARAEMPGRWRFELRPADGSAGVEVSDVEPDLWGERLELLTVIRALESLDQPSRVTLIGCSRYIEQGVLYGVAEWKNDGWRWDFFGQMAPVRDIDLWQRMDRVLQFHQVDCRRRRFDSKHGFPAGPHWDLLNNGKSRAIGFKGSRWIKCPRYVSVAWRGLEMKMASWVYKLGASMTRLAGPLAVRCHVLHDAENPGRQVAPLNTCSAH